LLPQLWTPSLAERTTAIINVNKSAMLSSPRAMRDGIDSRNAAANPTITASQQSTATNMAKLMDAGLPAAAVAMTFPINAVTIRVRMNWTVRRATDVICILAMLTRMSCCVYKIDVANGLVKRQ